MVQNPLEKVRLEDRYSNSSLFVKPNSTASKRVRSTSQPIPPLRLPIAPPPSPEPEPESSREATNGTSEGALASEMQPPAATHSASGVDVTNPDFTDPGFIDSIDLLDPLNPFPSASSPATAASIRLKLQPTFQSSVRRVSRTLVQTSHTVSQISRPITKVRLPAAAVRWLVIWFSSLGAFAGVTTLAFTWLASPPPSANCKEVTIASPGVQRLYCAQELARSGELKDLTNAIALLENWSPLEPLHQNVQEEIVDWSNVILVIARSKLDKSDFMGAVAAANQIPASSPVYLDAQREIATWQEEWRKGETILAAAQAAIKAQNWKQASEQVVELGSFGHEYWRLQQADVLFKQIVREKQARLDLIQAQKLAKDNQPDRLIEAITLAQKVPPSTYATAEAQSALQQWSQTVVEYALDLWRQGSQDAAFAIALKLPLLPNLPQLGKDLIQLSQANQLAAASRATPPNQLNLSQIWNLLEAISAVQQIAPDSPFYWEAKVAMEDWQMDLQDVTQMGFAQLVAQWQERSTLELATAQAQQVPLESPYRIQAQTLIAQWQKALQSLEDRPYLARAQSWSASGKIPDLRAAIAQVSQIPQDRAAWQQAQQLISQWTDQIETVEDQPIWDQAQKLAKQGKLMDAISEASKIQPDRALYDQVQAAIQQWQGKIAAAEMAADQPILDRAHGFAAQGSLTRAIDTAAQIAPGRALYNEAQAAIQIWENERTSWKGQDEQPTSSPTAPFADDPAIDFPAVDDSATPAEDAFTAPAEAEESSSSSLEGYYDERFYDDEP